MKRKRKATGPSEAQRQAIYLRAKGLCEYCGKRIHSGSVHHRTPRGMGGTSLDLNRLSNLILLCGSGTSGCHGWVEQNRNKARELGLIVPRETNTTHVPVINQFGMTQWLDDEGRTHTSPTTLDDK